MSLLVERSLQLTNRQGLHARPISRIIEIAKLHRARLEIIHGSQRADGRSVMELMMLGAGPQAVLKFRAEGDDAEELILALEKLIRERFGES